MMVKKRIAGLNRGMISMGEDFDAPLTFAEFKEAMKQDTLGAKRPVIFRVACSLLNHPFGRVKGQLMSPNIGGVGVRECWCGQTWVNKDSWNRM